MTSLHLKALAACLHCASSEETRYYLKGVFTHTDGEKRIYVSTDGHILCRITLPKFPGDANETLIIPSNKISDVLQLAKALDKKQLLWATEEFLRLEGKELKLPQSSIKFEPIDGTFPDYQRALPSNPEAPGAISFNIENLKKIYAAKKAFSDSRYHSDHSPTLTFYGERGPIGITFEKDTNTASCFYAVLMPVRL